jgi:ATP-dependent DNA helicase RecG
MPNLMTPVTSDSSRHPTDLDRPKSVREQLRALATPIQNLKGVGPKRAEQLIAAGLSTVEDILYHLPFRYDDRRELKQIAAAVPGNAESFVGELVMLQSRFILRRRSQMLTAILRDDTGALDLIWYRAPGYLVRALAKGQRLLVHGRVERGTQGRARIIHPDFEVIEAAEEASMRGVLPVYLRPGGLPLTFMRKLAVQVISEHSDDLPSRLPDAIRIRQQLIDAASALKQLHQPPPDADVASLNDARSTAHRSVIFDELFFLQLGLGLRKRARQRSPGISLGANLTALPARMRELLPFKPTLAQERVLREIESDLCSDNPMQRLVQGDVGSGKTMVAWLASLKVIEQGYQVLWMAPTELLAEQHFNNLKNFAGALGVSCGLLTSSTTAKDKKHLLTDLTEGKLKFVVGTHALIQEDVRVRRMGLGVIDEQHRFGVVQRLSLRRLVGDEAGSSEPHMLLMSATPIPRSLAMVLYGDMEVSYVDEMPPGRIPVKTKVFAERERRQLYSMVLEELKRGHQAFVVLPLVEASEQLDQVRDATQMAEKMRQTLFKDFGVGLVHGRMKTEERDAVMREFRGGKLGILVATTVIEVGIDIPNATVIVIEHAERFGLSQLHQLRGRVGRGKAPGFCFLVNRGPDNALAAERLRVMEKETDGFKIAEADLRLRGPGELLGTRQSGLADLHLANLTRDGRLLIEARKEALAWLEKDPTLKSKESEGMREILRHRWGKRLQLGAVG